MDRTGGVMGETAHRFALGGCVGQNEAKWTRNHLLLTRLSAHSRDPFRSHVGTQPVRGPFHCTFSESRSHVSCPRCNSMAFSLLDKLAYYFLIIHQEWYSSEVQEFACFQSVWYCISILVLNILGHLKTPETESHFLVMWKCGEGDRSLV